MTLETFLKSVNKRFIQHWEECYSFMHIKTTNDNFSYYPWHDDFYKKYYKNADIYIHFLTDNVFRKHKLTL